MIQIKINGKVVKNLVRIETIKTISIVASGFKVMIDRKEAKAIAGYMYDASQRCLGAITYNNVIVRKEDVKEMKV